VLGDFLPLTLAVMNLGGVIKSKDWVDWQKIGRALIASSVLVGFVHLDGGKKTFTEVFIKAPVIY